MAHEQSLVFLVGIFLMMAYGMYKTFIRGEIPHVRKIAALDAIDEGIGRSIEMGKKLQFVIPNDLMGPMASVTLISLTLMSYVARKAAKAGIPAVYTCATAPVLTVMQGMLRDIYAEQGKLEDFNNPEKVKVRMLGEGYWRFGAGASTALALAYPGLLQRENVGTTIFAGEDGKNLLLYGEAGREADCFQICLNPTSSKLSWAIATFDYVAMLSEVYTAGAWVTKRKEQLGSVIGTDIATWTMIVLVIVFTAVASILGRSLSGILVG